MFLRENGCYCALFEGFWNRGVEYDRLFTLCGKGGTYRLRVSRFFVLEERDRAVTCLLRGGEFSTFYQVTVVVFFFFLNLLLTVNSTSNLCRGTLLLFDDSCNGTRSDTCVLISRFNCLPSSSGITIVSRRNRRNSLSSLGTILVSDCRIVGMEASRVMCRNRTGP